jgi:predicted Zn-dependent protease
MLRENGAESPRFHFPEQLMHLLNFSRLLFIVLTGLLVGCANNSITGRSQLLLISEDSAISDSAKAYQGLISDLGKKGKLSGDEKLIARIRLITDRLIDQAVSYRPETRQWAWSITIIDDPKTVNAFCMAGGRMAIYTGLVEKITPSDDELAQVLGHEISHALLQHSREQMSEQMAAGLGVALIGATARDSSEQSTRQRVAGLGAMAFILLPHSRTAESEADRLGVELAARAGYHPHAAVTLWNKMLKESDGASGFDFLSTHPAPARRIDALAILEPAMMRQYNPGMRNSKPGRQWTSTPPNERFVSPSK